MSMDSSSFNERKIGTQIHRDVEEILALDPGDPVDFAIVDPSEPTFFHQVREVQAIVDKANEKTCEGCKNIKRMEVQIRPNNEDDYYWFRRAARQHYKECPNKED